MAQLHLGDIEGREAYVRLAHLLAESAFDANDEEIEEEMVELGEELRALDDLMDPEDGEE
ncbi:MAG: hypothetical protein GY719_20370 [bacterium]|nr:hypothetical protein [bacterium]